MRQFLRRLVVLQPGEAPALLASFATLLCMFASYTILRPVRDALGITSGLENIPYLFWGVFVVMLLLQPLYGWLTSRFPRSVFLPWVYGFFAAEPAHLLGMVPRAGGPHLDRAHLLRVGERVQSVRGGGVLEPDGGRVHREQAGRLFGFIWAGASTGGLIGPLIDRKLAVPLGAINLLPLSAALLRAVARLHGAGDPLAARAQPPSTAARSQASRRSPPAVRLGRRRVGRLRAGGALAVPAWASRCSCCS